METQEQRLDDLSHKMDKYDDIIKDLHVIVVALKAKDDADDRAKAATQKWVATMFTIGATVVSGAFGAIITYILTHLH